MVYAVNMNASTTHASAPTPSRKSPFGLEAWVDALAEMKVVSLSAIIAELNRLTASEESSIGQLANVIMRDPGLTSKVLRVANSALYNPGRQPINTVSRAIMHIGFNTVRAICVSAIVMESLLERHPRDGLLRQMAASFHAAVQARNLCERFRPEVREEVFVAALLLNLGQLLVWSSDYPVADQAYQLHMNRAPIRETEVLLGTTYARLTQEIAAQWSLGETLKAVLTTAETELDKRGEAVRLGEEISRIIEKGWQHEDMQALLKRVADFTGGSASQARARVETSMKEAAELSESYNDPRVTRLLEQTRARADQADASSEGADLLQPDSRVQLEVLQQIMAHMGQGLDSGKLFELLIKGLNRGVGLERISLLLFNQPRTQVTAKVVVGPQTAAWKEHMRFDFERSARNPLAQIIAGREAVLVQDGRPEALLRLLPDSWSRVTGGAGFLIGPLLAGTREVGFLYADLGCSHRPLQDVHVTGFKHFLQQANLCLGLMANRPKP